MRNKSTLKRQLSGPIIWGVKCAIINGFRAVVPLALSYQLFVLCSLIRIKVFLKVPAFLKRFIKGRFTQYLWRGMETWLVVEIAFYFYCHVLRRRFMAPRIAPYHPKASRRKLFQNVYKTIGKLKTTTPF